MTIRRALTALSMHAYLSRQKTMPANATRERPASGPAVAGIRVSGFDQTGHSRVATASTRSWPRQRRCLPVRHDPLRHASYRARHAVAIRSAGGTQSATARCLGNVGDPGLFTRKRQPDASSQWRRGPFVQNGGRHRNDTRVTAALFREPATAAFVACNRTASAAVRLSSAADAPPVAAGSRLTRLQPARR